ncbi:hypothetical protein [Marinobacter alexandrii]|uniref:hypothetical protein n=1 Tax=Marinobacter alexandrii TaxID=2570351 RepID=UPI0011092F19|nr:hypothetical protein [Marinobacter alexandrii]
MIEDILEVLKEQGPRTIPQLALILWCDEDDVCVPVSFLMLTRCVYMELDGTVWFVKEAAQ